jgi:hypothetical protein
MKKLLLGACALFFGVLSAQEIPFSMKTSEVFKDEYKHSYIQSVDDDEKGGVIIVRSFNGGVFSSGSGYYFERYDSSMKLIKEYEYAQKGNVLGVMVNDGQAHIVSMTYNKDRKAYVCVVNSASIEDFKFSERELFAVNSSEIKRFLFGSGSYDSDSGADMIVNEDRSAFAVTLDLRGENNQESHRLFLFDGSANLKFEHTFNRDIKDRKFKYENIDVSKDGNTLYLLGKVYTTEKKKKKEGGKYQYELTRIDKSGAKTQVFDTQEHFSGSLKAIVFDDRVVCIGFYSDRKDHRYKGLGYFEMDPATLAIRSSKFNPFTEQFIVDKYGKSKDKELKNLSFRGIHVAANGDIVFNAEEFYIVTHTYTTPNGGMSTRTTYHYDDIVSAKLSRSGDVLWARNINKRQMTGGDESYISYSSMIKGNDTYFFINTGEKVKKLRNDRIQFGQTSKKKSNLNIIRINNNGDFDYQEILDDKDSEMPFMVAFGAATQSDIYFIGRKGKKKQLLKVTI